MIKKLRGLIYTALVFLAVLVTTFSILTHLYPRKYAEYVAVSSKEYGIEESLIYAIIKCESNFEQTSLSHAGAYGLMQITESTFEWAKQKRGIDDKISIYSPDINIDYGCYIFSLFYDEFKNVDTALAAYNAGRGKVKAWLSDDAYSKDGITLNSIPFAETKNYVKKVQSTQKIYELLY